MARVDACTLNVQAGRDLNAQAVAIAATGDASIRAGNDINLTAAGTSYGESFNFGKKNRSEMRTTEDVGTRIAAAGNLTLMATQDINAIAAQVSSDKQLAVGAGRDINVLAGDSSGYTYNEIYYKTKGFLSSKTTHRIKEASWTQAVSSTFTGDSAVLMAGRDLNVVGSNVAAQRDLVMSADRNVNIVAEQNTANEYQYEKIKKSGFGALGGISYGSRQTTDWVDTKRGLNTGSTIGSVTGDVLINAGGSLNVVGSDVLARQGDITMIGRDVSIVGGFDTMRQREVHEVKQSGFTITASTPVVSAMQTGARMAEAAGKSGNAVMAGLAGATTALAASNAYDAVKAAGAIENATAIDKAGGGSIKISFGSSKSSSTTDRSSSTSVGSNIAAGNDLTIVAKGAGSASDITVSGSNLSAGNNAVLKAEGDILLQAAKNVFEQKTDSKSSGFNIGIGYSTGTSNGWTLELGASVSRGNENGRDQSWTNSFVTAGNVLALQSGGDTTLRGASGKAEQILASVGGNLLLESLQDTSTYTSKQTSGGVNLTVCVPPYCYGQSSVSGNFGTGKMNSNFKSVTEQTGLWAGDGGFLIDVKNNTTLIGSVIASSDKAVAEGLNKLSTGTLVTQDIKNSASYSANQIAVGGGFGFGGGASKERSAGLGTTKGNQVAGGATKDAGTSLASSGGFSANLPTVVAASGNSSSTTQSAISGGTIIIRDEEGQRALTGKTAAETIAALNRDTSDTLNALKPIFDKEKIEAGFEIASEASRQLGQFLTNRAKEADALSSSLAKELQKPGGGDAQRIAQLANELDSALKWAPGGDYRLISTAILGGISGNVSGGVSEAARASAVNYLQGLTAQQVKLFADGLGSSPQADATRAALHAIVGCAGGAAQGTGCSSSALGAGAASVVNALLDAADRGSESGLSVEQREARANLVSNLLAGVAFGLGLDAGGAVNSGRLETENNGVGLLLKRGGPALIGLCFRSATCQEKVIGPAAFAAISAAVAALRAANPQLEENQALQLAETRYITTPASMEPIPGKPGEPVPPLPIPPGQTGGNENVSVPGKPGDGHTPIGVPGQENNGSGEGSTTTTPMPEQQEPGIILNETTDTPGDAARLVGQRRETSVAQIVNGSVSGEQVAVPGLGSTDIDVVAANGDLVAVGGPAKAKNLGNLGQELRIYKAIADQRGVEAKAYFAEGTPESVINLATKILGERNVKIFSESR